MTKDDEEFERQNQMYGNARKAYEARHLDTPDDEPGAKPAQPAAVQTNQTNPYTQMYEGEANDYLARLADVVEAPLREKERLRRERGAHSIAGINALGRVASAFGNLLYTPSGAAPLGDTKGVDINQMHKNFVDEQKDLASRYIAAGGQRLATVKAMKDGWDAQEALRVESARKMQELQLKIDAAEREGRLNEAKILREQAQAEKARYDGLASKVKAAYASQYEQSRVDANNARVNASNASAANSTANANKTRMSSHKTIVAGDKSYEIPLDKYNEANLSSVISYMGGNPESVKRTVKYVGGMESSANATYQDMKLEAMASWIGKNLRNNPNGQDALERLVNGKGMPSYRGTAPGVGGNGGNTMPGVKTK